MSTRRVLFQITAGIVVFFIFSSFSFASDPNLVGWWELDESSGTIASDSSGNEHHGTLIDFADPDSSWTDGVIGNCLTFNGTNEEYVEVTDYKGISGSQARTTCAWIKLSSTGSVGNILSYGSSDYRGSWLFMVNADSKLQLGVNGGNMIGVPSLAVDRWYHVAAVLDDWNSDGLTVSDLRLYINGQEVSGTYTNPNELLNTGNTYPVRIGTHIAISNFFNGLIDEVRMYDAALSAEQIADLIGPALFLSENDFIFTTDEAGSNPSDQYLTIQNIGGILHWSIDTTGKPDWLTLAPTSGTLSVLETEPVTISVDTTGLSGNHYSYSFEVADPNALNSPQQVTVHVHISTLFVPQDYPTIQAAISAAASGDTVIVMPGTYTGSGNKNLDFGGKAITVRSVDPNDPAIVAATVIDCEYSGRGFYFHSGETADSVAAGFTITKGFVVSGGGISCDGSSPTINNCTFIGNKIYYTNGKGGGMYNTDSNPILNNCQFINNIAGYGGGIYNYRSDPYLNNCLFIENSIDLLFDGEGGGIYNGYLCYPTLIDCQFIENSAFYGGAISQEYSVMTANNCIFIGNSADSKGGGIANNLSNLTLTNCTFAGNLAEDGKAIVSDRNPSPTGMSEIYVTNCILWDGGNEIFKNEYTWTVITYNDIQGGYSGTGNINLDPLFVTGPSGACYLSQTAAGQAVNSPCVDSGSASAASFGLDTLTTRTDQITDAGVVDMGYHYALRYSAGDLNQDSKVNLIDFKVFSNYWQMTSCGFCGGADLTGDGTVQIDDLEIIAANWLTGVFY